MDFPVADGRKNRQYFADLRVPALPSPGQLT